MSAGWLAVASAEHVRRGCSEDFMQVVTARRRHCSALSPATAWCIIRRR